VTSSSTNAPIGPACQTSTPWWIHCDRTSPAIDIGSGATAANVIGGTGITFNAGPLATSKLTITTTDDDVRLNGAVTLNSDLTIDTGSAGAGDITFTNSATINSQGAEHNDLLLNAGTGSVFFNANIGAATATSSLGTMTVTTASGGVAIFAHIGGFVFGAVVALLVRGLGGDRSAGRRVG